MIQRPSQQRTQNRREKPVSLVERDLYAAEALQIKGEYSEIFWIGVACLGLCLVSIIVALEVPSIADGLAILS
jgi:hypothetical protein